MTRRRAQLPPCTNPAAHASEGHPCEAALAVGSEAATPAPATSETNEQRTRGLGARVRSRSADGHEDSMINEDRVADGVGAPTRAPFLSRRPAVFRRLYAIDATRLQE